ncbi:MAG: hypothetical protein ACJAZO_005203 [Myxococcota bacterium]|jgi:hypothetical protein
MVLHHLCLSLVADLSLMAVSALSQSCETANQAATDSAR